MWGLKVLNSGWPVICRLRSCRVINKGPTILAGGVIDCRRWAGLGSLYPQMDPTAQEVDPDGRVSEGDSGLGTCWTFKRTLVGLLLVNTLFLRLHGR